MGGVGKQSQPDSIAIEQFPNYASRYLVPSADKSTEASRKPRTGLNPRSDTEEAARERGARRRGFARCGGQRVPSV